jgi:hypothetical protein
LGARFYFSFAPRPPFVAPANAGNLALSVAP